VNTTLALDFYTSGGVYEVTVSEHTARYATKTREQWRKELLQEEDADGEAADGDAAMAVGDSDSGSGGSGDEDEEGESGGGMTARRRSPLRTTRMRS